MQIEITNLKTVSSYAKLENVTPAAIYKRQSNAELNFVEIDGTKFVDITRYPPKTK